MQYRIEHLPQVIAAILIIQTLCGVLKITPSLAQAVNEQSNISTETPTIASENPFANVFVRSNGSYFEQSDSKSTVVRTKLLPMPSEDGGYVNSMILHKVDENEKQENQSPSTIYTHDDQKLTSELNSEHGKNMSNTSSLESWKEQFIKESTEYKAQANVINIAQQVAANTTLLPLAVLIMTTTAMPNRKLLVNAENSTVNIISDITLPTTTTIAPSVTQERQLNVNSKESFNELLHFIAENAKNTQRSTLPDETTEWKFAAINERMPTSTATIQLEKQNSKDYMIKTTDYSNVNLSETTLKSTDQYEYVQNKMENRTETLVNSTLDATDANVDSTTSITNDNSLNIKVAKVTETTTELSLLARFMTPTVTTTAAATDNINITTITIINDSSEKQITLPTVTESERTENNGMHEMKTTKFSTTIPTTTAATTITDIPINPIETTTNEHLVASLASKSISTSMEATTSYVSKLAETLTSTALPTATYTIENLDTTMSILNSPTHSPTSTSTPTPISTSTRKAQLNVGSAVKMSNDVSNNLSESAETITVAVDDKLESMAFSGMTEFSTTGMLSFGERDPTTTIRTIIKNDNEIKNFGIVNEVNTIEPTTTVTTTPKIIEVYNPKHLSSEIATTTTTTTEIKGQIGNEATETNDESINSSITKSHLAKIENWNGIVNTNTVTAEPPETTTETNDNELSIAPNTVEATTIETINTSNNTNIGVDDSSDIEFGTTLSSSVPTTTTTTTTTATITFVREQSSGSTIAPVTTEKLEVKFTDSTETPISNVNETDSTAVTQQSQSEFVNSREISGIVKTESSQDINRKQSPEVALDTNDIEISTTPTPHITQQPERQKQHPSMIESQEKKTASNILGEDEGDLHQGENNESFLPNMTSIVSVPLTTTTAISSTLLNIIATTEMPVIHLLNSSATTSHPIISTKFEDAFSNMDSSTESTAHIVTTTVSISSTTPLTPSTTTYTESTMLETTSRSTLMIAGNEVANNILAAGGNGEDTNTPETDVNVIIAISVSVIGVVALLLLIAFLYLMRKRQKQMSYGQRCRPVSMDAYSLDNVSVLGSVRQKNALRKSKRSYGNAAFDDPSLRHNLLNSNELIKFAERRSNIYEEFRDVPQIIARADEVQPGCEDKNRYANVIPLPETRVKLQRLNDDEKTEYINANYVRGPQDGSNYYIACQAPMEMTVADFWRMIWEQQSRVIIQATDLIENGIEKCAEYLPPSVTLDNHNSYGDFHVTLKHREVKDRYAISTVLLKHTLTDESRELTHYWYKWPETGVPHEEAPMIAMLLEARSSLKSYTLEHAELKAKSSLTALNVQADEKESEHTDANNGNREINGNNIVNDKLKAIAKNKDFLTVHCSPGTGRTGTIIACDIAIRSLETPKRSVNIPQIVYYVRRGRASAVQTKDQYEFIYKVASMYATKITNLSNDS